MNPRFPAPAALLLALAATCARAHDIAGCSMSFDAVATPALPDGWSSVDTAQAVIAAVQWQTQSGDRQSDILQSDIPQSGNPRSGDADSPPNTAHLPDHGATRYEAALLSPVFNVPDEGAVLSFRQRRAYSWANTAAVLEIAIAGGDFIDIAAARGQFLEGGYDGRSFASNPLGERRAWLASPDRYSETRVRLPHAADGKSVQLRFRAGSSGTGDDSPGWYVDSIVCEAP